MCRVGDRTHAIPSDPVSVIEIDMSESSLIICEEEYCYAGVWYPREEGEAYVLFGTCEDGNYVSVANDASAHLILDGVTINNPDGAAIVSNSASVGDVTITIADGSVNTLIAGNGRAAISKSGYVGEGIGTLTIQGGPSGTGVLYATGAAGAAGIGGDRGEGTCNIFISGGIIEAKGGSGAAGIGTGANGSLAKNIGIDGGFVTAIGGEYGAGIGGGTAASLSKLVIEDGILLATGGYNAAGIGGGGAQSGVAGNASSLTFMGGTVSACGGGEAFDIGAGMGSAQGTTTDIVICGGSIKADTVGCIPTNGADRSNQELFYRTIENPNGVEVLVYKETMFRYFWNVVNHTALDSEDTTLHAWIPQDEELRLNAVEEIGQIVINIANGDLVIYEDTYTYKGVSHSYAPETVFFLSGTTEMHNVTVAKDVSANLILSNLEIDLRESELARPAICIEQSSVGSVNIALAEMTTNRLYGAVGCAGIETATDAGSVGQLTIEAQEEFSGMLEVYGGAGAAAIGAAEGLCANSILISSGKIYAYGGAGAAAIGGANGSRVLISGGAVEATGGLGAAGIGGNAGADEIYVEISGGTVTAYGGDTETATVYDIGAGVSMAEDTVGGECVIYGGSVKAQSASGVTDEEGNAVQGITISNLYRKPVLVNGIEWNPMTHQALDENDTNLYVWLSEEDTYYVTREMPHFMAPTACTGLVYNGSEQTLIDSGYTGGGTMYYSLDTLFWSTELPTAVNAGEYKVYYLILGTDVYEDVYDPDTMYVTVTIEGATLGAPKGLSFIAETCYGKADGQIKGLTTEMEYSLDEGVTYMPVSDAGMLFAAGDVYVRYILTENYSSAEACFGSIYEGPYLSVTFDDSTGVEYITDVSADCLAWNSSLTFTVVIVEGYEPDEDFAIYVDGIEIALDEEYSYTITNIQSNLTVTVEGVCDNSLPEMSGLPEGVEVFYVTQQVVITDNDLERIVLNGVKCTDQAAGLILAGNVDTVYSIMAMDQSGNGVIWEVQMKPIATLSESIDHLTVDTVTSADRERIQAVLDTVCGIELTYATDEECEEIQAIIDLATSYLERLDEVSAAQNTEAVLAVGMLNEENVTLGAADSIASAIIDLQNVLSAYANVTVDNLTSEEQQAIDEEILRLQELLQYVETMDAIINGGCTLNLDGIIYINQYVSIQGYTELDITDRGGLLTWNAEIEEQKATYDTADFIHEGLYQIGDSYMQATQGIPVAQYGEDMYMRVYLRLDDGSYVYGPLNTFSVKQYCERAIEKYEGQESQLRDTCVALLHYGAAAQMYFGYKVDSLANAEIVDAYPAEEWNADFLTQLDAFETDIIATEDVVLYGKSLELVGAIRMNYYFEVDSFEVASAELMVWQDVEELLTEDNITDLRELSLSGNYYKASFEMIAAADYGRTIFVCARFVDTQGEVHYSEVIAYSPEAYAQRVMEVGTNETLIETMKRMVMYGEDARVLFGRDE